MKEILNHVNARLGQFCFNQRAELIQFVHLPITSATNSECIISFTKNAPIKTTDSWDDWYRRCLSPASTTDHKA